MNEETAKSDKKELSYVGISELRPSRYNMFSTDQYSELKESIRAVGLLTPLTVIGSPGAYDILSGERRYRAISDLHKEDASLFEKVPVYIIGDTDMNTTKQQVIIEVANLEARSESDYNVHDHRFRLLRLIRDMAASPEEENKLIADIFKNSMKLSTRYRNMYKNVFNNGNDEIISMVSANDETHITLPDASNLSSLNKENQKKALDRIHNGEKPKDVYDDLAAAEGKKKPAQEENEIPSFDTSAFDGEDDYGSYESPSSDSAEDDSYEDDPYNGFYDSDDAEDKTDDEAEDEDASKMLSDFNNAVDEELGVETEQDDDYDFEKLFGKKYHEESYMPDAVDVRNWMQKIMKKHRSEFTEFEEEVYELAEKWVSRGGNPDGDENDSHAAGMPLV